MIQLFCVFLFASLEVLAAPIDDQTEICGEPEFFVKAPPKMGTGGADSLNLLNEDEKKNPELAQRVLATPGGYGNSELGIRYLSRMFGYQANFDTQTKEKVESWLMTQESENSALYHNVFPIWEKWAMDNEHRLEVPSGALNKFPTDGNPKVFFSNARAQANYSNCVRTEVAKLMCENSLGNGRKIGREDRVYFGNPNGKGRFCKVAIPDWKMKREAHEAAQAGKLNDNNVNAK